MEQTYDFRRYSGIPYLPLYKYYSNYSYAEDVIKNHRIHLESPSTYNDLYDSAYALTIDNLGRCVNTSHNVCLNMKNLLDSKYYDAIEACDNSVSSECFSINEFVDFVCKYDNQIVREELINECIYAITGGKLVQADNNKISCFSERGDSLLLWAYYANNYKGVCLEFDIKSDTVLSKFCSKVNYTRAFCQNANSFDNYYLKSDEWAHEQEWRIVCSTTNEYLPTTSLRAIILGDRTPAIHRARFIKLGKANGLKVYIVHPDTNEFKLKRFLVREF